MIRHHKDRTTPDYPAVFVFGSNLAGIHGAGAAKVARFQFSAQLGVGFGRTGMAYAIPTKDGHFHTLPLKSVKESVREFLSYAQQNMSTQFFVTRVGCGLAGFDDAVIAPLFKNAPANCDFPDEWLQYLAD